MGLFHSNYDKPGPGVRKDEPRKKGAARFFEILGRDFGDLFRANLLCVVGFLPVVALIFFGIFSNAILVSILGGLLGGIVCGPFFAGLHDTILRTLRDEPGFWWTTYKRAFSRNWKASLLPGAILGFLLASQIFMAYCIFVVGLQITLPVAVMLILNVLLTAMVFPFLFSQLVLMDLPFFDLVKNSLLLALGNAPKVLVMALLQVIYWSVMLLLLPFSLIWAVVFGFAFIELITLMIAFSILDKTFDLERQLKEMRDNELNNPHT